jgi:hypothetical protein
MTLPRVNGHTAPHTLCGYNLSLAFWDKTAYDPTEHGGMLAKRRDLHMRKGSKEP